MSATQKDVDQAKAFMIVTCGTCMPGLGLWSYFMFKIIKKKSKVHVVSIICGLLVVYNILYTWCSIYSYMIILGSQKGTNDYIFGTNTF